MYGEFELFNYLILQKEKLHVEKGDPLVIKERRESIAIVYNSFLRNHTSILLIA
jgi:hypothetical protein